MIPFFCTDMFCMKNNLLPGREQQLSVSWMCTLPVFLCFRFIFFHVFCHASAERLSVYSRINLLSRRCQDSNLGLSYSSQVHQAFSQASSGWAQNMCWFFSESMTVIFGVNLSSFWGVAEQSIRFCGRMTQNQNILWSNFYSIVSGRGCGLEGGVD